jgi:hypothetical protein
VWQGHGQSGVNREYVLSTVAAIETEGFRDPQWHQLAMTLHDDVRSLHPPLREGRSTRMTFIGRSAVVTKGINLIRASGISCHR